MKKSLQCLLALVMLTFGLSAAFAQHEHLPNPQSNAGFEKLKSLAGQWQGTKPDGKPVTVTYQIASGGNSLVETIEPSGEPSMIKIICSKLGR